MSREIKYRAWDKAHNYMNKWHEVKRWSFKSYEDDNIVLMQYTGLTDTNGTEIYEGDIVEIDLYEYAGVKETNMICVGENIGNRTYFADVSYLSGMKREHIKILGNKFENPELLEADHE